MLDIRLSAISAKAVVANDVNLCPGIVVSPLRIGIESISPLRRQKDKGIHWGRAGKL
jgi:hypothetical protein